MLLVAGRRMLVACLIELQLICKASSKGGHIPVKLRMQCSHRASSGNVMGFAEAEPMSSLQLITKCLRTNCYSMQSVVSFYI